MALWECNKCGCRFAVGLRMCPQCTSESVHEYTGGTEVSPKISKATGATVAGQEGGDAWDGNSSSTSTEKPVTTSPLSEQSDQSPAPTTESHSATDQTESASADSTDGETPAAEVVPPYGDWLKDALMAECASRELATTGTKAELVARLEEHDASQADNA